MPEDLAAGSERLAELGTEGAEPAVERPCFHWQLPVVLVEYTAMALNRSVLPELLSNALGRSVYLVSGLAEGVRGLLAFGSSPAYGVWSDRHGRRLPMAVAAAGYGAPHVVYAMSGSIWAYIVASGLSGLFNASLPLGFAYIADTVPRQGRAAAIGLMMATFGVSMAVGPLGGGLIAARFGTHVVFVVSSVLTGLSVLYILYILPESLQTPDVPPRPLDWRKASPVGSMRMLLASGVLTRLALIAFLYYTALWTVISQLLLYARRRFAFSATQSGALLMIVGSGMMLSEGLLIRLLLKCMSERMLLQSGLMVFTVFMVLLGLASSGWQLYAATSLAGLFGLVQPCLAALVSQAVSPSQQGQAQGSINGVKAIAEGIAPVIAGAAFFVCEDFEPLPGLPFIASGLLTAAAAVIAAGIEEVGIEEVGANNEEEKQIEWSLAPTSSSSETEDAQTVKLGVEMCLIPQSPA